MYSSGDFTNCIRRGGGSLLTSVYDPYIRGVKATNYTSAIYWTDPNDLKLSVLINGNREFLDEQEYNERKGEIDTVEGVAVIAGGEKFAVYLTDAQTDAISEVEVAMDMYGDILPTANQGKIISAKWTDVNEAIEAFGGTFITPPRLRILQATLLIA